MKQLETYLQLCTQYYDLDKPTALARELSFYLKQAQQTKGKILEPMCGTGRFLIPLMEKGLKIEGFDASQTMLNALYAKCTKKHLNPTVWHGFLEDWHATSQYSLVFIPSGSFGLITDLNRVRLSLKNIFSCLKSGGVFVFEAETLPGQANQSIPTTAKTCESSYQTRPDGKRIALNTICLGIQKSICQTLCKYELIDNHTSQVLQTEAEIFQIRLYPPKQMLALLTGAGFASIKMFKAFNLDKKFSYDDKTVVYKCIK